MSTPFIATAASIALLAAGFAATEGTRSAAVIPTSQIVEEAQLAGGAANCTPSQVDPSPKGEGTDAANANAPASSCDQTQSPDQSETPQNGSGQTPAVQTPTAFAPGLPLAPFIAVPAGAAGIAVATSNDSAG